jgi:DNA-binding transcriptional MerR regulator
MSRYKWWKKCLPAYLDVNVKVRYNSNMTSQVIGNLIASPAGSGEHFLRIGDVALRTGLTQRTIRYYEELGLLPTTGRTQGDFRLFSEHDILRLEKIVKLRDLFHFSLAEIRDAIAAEETLDQLRSEYEGTEDIAVKIRKLDQAQDLVRSQLELLDRKVSQMQELKGELEARLARYTSKRGQLETELGGSTGPVPGEAGS